MSILSYNNLEDIIDTIEFEFEDEPTIFTEETIFDFIETAFHLMDDYIKENPTAISEPDFHEIMLEEIKAVFYVQFEDHIQDIEDLDEDIDDILEYTFNVFISTFHTERSEISSDNILISTDNNFIENQINILRNIEQPKQRTTEWYEFRNNLITASNAYKAFESQSMINQLIYEKCQPIVIDDSNKFTNVNSPLHWGQKYEPLSVMIYEKHFNTTVEDFGCIKHPFYSFLGASPDGINVDKKSPRYGRMLEIKNVVSRVINGIPKKEYWIQMQLQMEVCNLDECDFLETKFTEYENYDAFENDNEYFIEYNNALKIKGIIIYFHNDAENKPFYIYKPLVIINQDDIIDWQQKTITLYQSSYTFIRLIYWKLEVLNCILVSRNKDWFKHNITQLENVWKTIEAERITGYEHRSSKKNKPTSDTINKYFEKVIKLDN
jgi:putative phage-type endonuclease